MGKRPDGYHDLVTLMCPVSLYDTLTLDFDQRGFSVACDDPAVPLDGSNLAFRAAKAFWGLAGQNVLGKTQGVGITIKKRIPVGAGLGGGSSNAAGVLLALNRHFGNPIPSDDLLAAGLTLGADVPFFIYGRPALATGVGEKLEAWKGLPAFSLVLIFPGFSVSTAAVFQNLNFGLTKPQIENKKKPFTRGPFNPKGHLHNDLERVTSRRHPEVFLMKEALAAGGAEGALMTGSGPTVFGLFQKKEMAEMALARMHVKPKWRVFLAGMIV